MNMPQFFHCVEWKTMERVLESQTERRFAESITQFLQTSQMDFATVWNGLRALNLINTGQLCPRDPLAPFWIFQRLADRQAGFRGKGRIASLVSVTFWSLVNCSENHTVQRGFHNVGSGSSRDCRDTLATGWADLAIRVRLGNTVRPSSKQQS